MSATIDALKLDDLAMFKKLMKELVKRYEFKALRMTLRNNYELCSQLNLTELNKEIPMN